MENFLFNNSNLITLILYLACVILFLILYIICHVFNKDLSKLSEYLFLSLSILIIIFNLISSVAFSCGYYNLFDDIYINIKNIHIDITIFWIIFNFIIIIIPLYFFIAVLIYTLESIFWTTISYVSIISDIVLTFLILICFYERLTFENILNIDFINNFLEWIENYEFINFFISIIPQLCNVILAIFIAAMGTFIGQKIYDANKKN